MILTNCDSADSLRDVARLNQIVIDCENPARLARFWCGVLDQFQIRPYDDIEIARLAAIGCTPETDPIVLVDGPHLELCFQQAEIDGRDTKRRLHFELATANVVDWSDLEVFWTGLADRSGCDWAVFGQPFANRTVGRCVIGIGEGLVTSTLACESVLEATGMDPRNAFRSFPVGETRVALFRDPANPEDDHAWLDAVSLLAEYLVKTGVEGSPS